MAKYSVVLKYIRNILFLVGNAFNKIAKLLYQSPQEKRVVPWFNDRGDKTHRLFYDLNHDSIVFDLGGYEGQWTSDIFSMYCSNIYIFEPVPIFFQDISKRFKINSKIYPFMFGLSGETKTMNIRMDNNASSVYLKAGNICEISLIKVSDFFMEHNIVNVDLMKINIEGGEYDVLEHLLDTSLIRLIRNIQIQFHDFVPNAESRMKNIQRRLEDTHHLTYQYPFVWENWTLT